MSQRNCRGQQAPSLVVLAFSVALGASWAGMASPARAEESQSLEVRSVERREGAVIFDLVLTEGLPEKQIAELDQGERVTVRWEVELIRDRKLWFNTTVAKLELRANAVYDPLTQRYALERHAGKQLIDVAEAGQRDEALEWLTRVQEAVVEVPAKAFEKPRLRWRVRAVLDRKLVLLVLPTTVATEWDKGVFGESGPEEEE